MCSSTCLILAEDGLAFGNRNASHWSSLDTGSLLHIAEAIDAGFVIGAAGFLSGVETGLLDRAFPTDREFGEGSSPSTPRLGRLAEISLARLMEMTAVLSNTSFELPQLTSMIPLAAQLWPFKVASLLGVLATNPSAASSEATTLLFLVPIGLSDPMTAAFTLHTGDFCDEPTLGSAVGTLLCAVTSDYLSASLLSGSSKDFNSLDSRNTSLGDLRACCNTL